ncbi:MULTISPECIES: CsgG/HfaB family protein [Pseudomonas]|jgi:curli production assembly/transport component CsgG|uniref:Curli production assembly/transport component CsgG n=1 Tax=Pseudomonas putida (strain W619) TaxID=390235 RepID=B1J8A6_PSEPW|nr:MULTISPECIES: CsgG/HfaB family protein [Pseudomonas]MDH1575679.1 curli production assembly/transport protein CsgG [Pseudomonas sp. GD03746]QQE86456.1 curli production assembly/transport protein CsgG [Pseudomonas putida]UTL83479.1 curli production assembly/transport protein CsgG [Pseudomonas putida]HEN8712683.1 curli production assembly/transport protein CsgG [Pseudomonas putida]HEN8717803.1 curli production assembly/transport protein CsgG [Pseudomonas putida]
MKRLLSTLLILAALQSLQGCGLREPMSAEQDSETPTLTPRASTYYDLINMPRPKGRLMAVVYGFRDQTGQYKPTPASSFSTSVTQGAASMLMDALNASGWFVVLEREGLQNLLTERKIIRASQKKADVPENIQTELPPLQAANLMLEGGIIAYDTNVRSGGEGARYLGIDISREYRVDQVTVNLRAVDVRTGQVLANVMTSKTIYSVGRSAGVFKFIEFKKLLEAEVGYTTNEPAQLCVLSAIESAVGHLLAQGIERRLWQVAGDAGDGKAAVDKYLSQSQAQ